MNKSDASPATPALTKELVVQNKMGIHARPAAMIVRITNKYKAEVFVEKDEAQVNGKSIMGLMMLAAGKGSKVKFIATPAIFLHGAILRASRLFMTTIFRLIES